MTRPDASATTAVMTYREALRLLGRKEMRRDDRGRFISFGCTPDLADDTEATIVQATGLWDSLDQPYVMIRALGTTFGLPPMEYLTCQGINVNVTLLFSIERYEQVIGAYLRGLRSRARASKPLAGIASVASFFLSRIDTNVDAQRPDGSPLRGRVAIASARVAYQCYMSKFAGTDWEHLQAVGAARPPPLWASTGTQNPGYSDILYVAKLIGPRGRSTRCPIPTLRAFVDHGQVTRTLDAHPAKAMQTLADVAGAGIELGAVTAELEREGVRSFCDFYHQLLDCIDAKLNTVAAVGTR